MNDKMAMGAVHQQYAIPEQAPSSSPGRTNSTAAFGKIPSFFHHYFLKEEGVNLPETTDFRQDQGGIFARACDNLPK